jgi:sugar phosphate isomerase/epimerase
MSEARDHWALSGFGDEIACDLEDQIAVLRELDVTRLELRSAWGVNVVELDDGALDRAAARLREAGIGVSAIASPVGKTSINGDFDRELRRLDAAFDAAERVGAGMVRVFSFYVGDRPAAHRDEVLRRMEAMAARARARGVTLVHENESAIYGDVPERCRDLVESVGSPALRVALDPGNFALAGVRPWSEAWPLLREHVVHVHVKDAVAVEGLQPALLPEDSVLACIRLAGEGEGQVPELLSGLDREGYAGVLTVEPHLRLRLPDRDGPGCFAAAVAAVRGLLGRTARTREEESP